MLKQRAQAELVEGKSADHVQTVTLRLWFAGRIRYVIFDISDSACKGIVDRCNATRNGINLMRVKMHTLPAVVLVFMVSVGNQ